MKKIILTALILFSVFVTYAQNIELHVQKGHTKSINSIDVSFDDKYIVTGGTEGSIQLWEFATGREIRSFVGHTRAVSSVCFTEDFKYIVSGGYDKKVILWDVKTGKIIREFIGHNEAVNSVDISKNGKHIVSAGAKIIKWELNSGKKLFELQDTEHFTYPGIRCVRYSPDSKYIAAISVKGKLVIWNATKKTKQDEFYISPEKKLIPGKIDVYLKEFEGSDYTDAIRMTKEKTKRFVNEVFKGIDKDDIADSTKLQIHPEMSSLHDVINVFSNTALKFTSDGKYLVAADSTMLLYNMQTKQKKYLKVLRGNAAVKAIEFSPDEKDLYVIKGDKLLILDFVNGAVSEKFLTVSNSYTTLKMFNKLPYLIASKQSGSTGVHSLSDKEFSVIKLFYPLAYPVGKSAFNFAGNRFATGINSYDKSVRIWDLSTAQQVALFDIDRAVNNKITYLEFAPTDYGDFISIISDDKPSLTKVGKRGGKGKISIVASMDGKNYVPTKILNVDDGIYSASFNPNPSTFTLAVGGGEGNVLLIDYVKGKLNRVLTGHSEWVRAVSYFPNPKYLASGTFFPKNIDAENLGGQVYVWSVGDSLPVRKYHVPDSAGVYSIVATNEGQLLVGGSKDIYSYLIKHNMMKTYKAHTRKVNCLDVSPDNTQFASGSDDNTLKIWDLKTGTVKFNIKDHYSNVNSVHYHPSGKFLLSSGNDGTTKLIDTKTGKIIVSFIATEFPVRVNDKFVYERSYICVTPDNYYMSPTGKPVGACFVDGMKSYGFEQFDLKYNRPDIILRRIGLASDTLINLYEKAYQKRLRKMGFNENMFNVDWHVPIVKIKNMNDFQASVNKNKTIKLEVFAKDTKYKLDRFNVWINDVPLFGMKGVDLRKQNTKKFEKTIEIKLSEGNNKIQVSTINQKGVESFKKTVFVNYIPEQKKKHDLYFVSIGVSEYNNSDYNLDYAQKDAGDLTTLFESKKDLYENVFVKKFYDKDATVDNILKVKEFLKQSNVDDQVIVFFAGHGILDDDLEYYLATAEVDLQNLSETALAYNDFENLIDNIPARKKMLLIDACHSGEVDKDVEMKEDSEVFKEKRAVVKFSGKTRSSMSRSSKLSSQNSFELMKALFTDLRKGTGAVVISSAGGGEYAIEGKVMRNGKVVDIQNGIFTHSLIQGVCDNNADSNKDGVITVSELKNYVFDNVTRLSAGYQNPTSRKENLEMDFTIW